MPGSARPRCRYVSLHANARVRTALVGLTAILCVLLLHTTAARAQNPPVTISVDANANRRPINPNIYGVAHAILQR